MPTKIHKFKDVLEKYNPNVEGIGETKTPKSIRMATTTTWQQKMHAWVSRQTQQLS